MDLETANNMARVMKRMDEPIRQAIKKCQADQHGVVELRFSDKGTNMSLSIADEPYESDVRVYPGE